MEVWNIISEKYSVSNFGRFWSVKKGVIEIPLHNGYPTLRLTLDKKSIVNCHVIVAKLFIPNPENKPCVNHKNGVRHDNRVENLEWVTHSENLIHAYNILGRSGAPNLHRRKTIMAKKDGITLISKGIRQMARDVRVPHQGVSNGIKNGWKYNGWQFELIYDPKWVPKSGK